MPKNGDSYSRRGHNVSLSKLQSPMTTKWLHDNYEISTGVSLPRSSLYSHYLDFCQKNCLESVNAASFGKIIRQTFPCLKTRRLGTRGQSNVKESSPYHDTVYNATRQSASGFSQTYSRSEIEGSNQPSKSHSHTSQLSNLSNGMLLPDFPNADTFDIEDAKIKDKVKTFLIMYRAHCQRILDTILRANFSEVQHFLLHFWRGMPQHISVILDKKEVIELIASCDNILYKAVSGVLIPGTLQPLPTSLTQAIKQFAKQLCSWLEVSLHHLPEALQDKKLLVAKAFSQMLCRQTSLSHLAQAARSVLNSVEPVNQMVEDMEKINVTNIIEPTLWMSSGDREKNFKLIYTFFEEFAQLLKQQATVDQYADWIASLVNRCVISPSEKEEKSFQKCAQHFLLMWSFICSKFIQELTLKSAKSFGSYHLLQMLFDDYIFFLLESHAIVSEDLEDGLHEFPMLRGRHSDISEFPSFTSIFNDATYPNAQVTEKSCSARSSSFSLISSSYRDSIPSPAREERDVMNIQSAMSLPGSFAANRSAGTMTFPYDNPPVSIQNNVYHGNAFDHDSRGQKFIDKRELSFMDDHSSGQIYPYKQGAEYTSQNVSGPFLTQELERLHMTYGSENFFDRNYFFQRELRT
eukprot:gene10996-12159_t